MGEDLQRIDGFGDEPRYNGERGPNEENVDNFKKKGQGS